MIRHAGKIRMLWAIGALLCASSPALADLKQKVDANEVSTIEVRLTSGNVQLMAWNGDHITIEHRRSPLPVVAAQGVLKIGAGSSPDKKISDAVKIYAPQHLRLMVITESADVTVQGFNSRIQIVTMGGDAQVSSCSAPLEIETVSGDIELKEIKGDLSLKTVSGTISGNQLKAAFMESKSVNGALFFTLVSTRQLRIRTHSGSVDFRGSLPDNGFWEASTFDGTMRFTFDAGAPLDLEAHSRRGQVSVDDDVTAQNKANNYFRGRMATGKTLVRLTSYEGNIDVRIED